jgi:hypothetical protein
MAPADSDDDSADECAALPGARPGKIGAKQPPVQLIAHVSAGVNTLLRHAQYLKLPDNICKAARISNKARRAANIPALQERPLQSLVQSVVAIILRLFELWAPNDVAGLYAVVRARLDKHFRVKAGIGHTAADGDSAIGVAAATVLQSLPPRSQEAKAIRAVLGGAGKPFLATVLADVAAARKLAHAAGDDSDVDNDDGKEEQGGDEHGSSDDEGEHAHGAAGHNKTAKTVLTAWAYLRARRNFRAMATGQTLQRVVATRARRTDAAVQEVVDFLYRSDNTSTLSWGCTRLQISGKEEVLQARNRQRSMSRLWLAYKAEISLKLPPVPRASHVQRSSFFEIASAVTERDLKVR